MKHEHLKQFELKAPDYDYVERPEFHEEALPRYAPARFAYKNGVWESTQAPSRKDTVKILFTGDLTCFHRQIQEAAKKGAYDFRYEFDCVRGVFEQADLVVGNLETMTDPHAPYRSEKLLSEQNYFCNAPVEFLEALRYAGFDMLTNANNHDLDTGVEGLAKTIEYAQRLGFIQTGTFREEKKHYELLDVHGFRIAVTAFATEHNHKHVNLTPEGERFLLNNYSRENAAEIIAQARAEGAEVVFVCIHWGKEHKTVQNQEQEAMAQTLAELGYDCIIGSHPHVLQPFGYVQAREKQVPVFYSMGNFVSHNVDNVKSRTIIASIDLTRQDGRVSLSCKYIPAYTSAGYRGRKFVVLPIGENAQDPGNVEKRNAICSVLGEQLGIDGGLSIAEYKEDSVRGVKKSKKKPDLQQVTSWPYSYDNETFRFSVYEGYAFLDGRSPASTPGTVTIPAKVLDTPVIEMREGLFENDAHMKKVNFSRDICDVPERAFRNCIQLEGFQLGRNVMRIQEEAFAGCSGLVCAVMREKLYSIGPRAFANCESLRSVKIPSNVTFIAEDAFENCPGMTLYCEPDSYAEEYAKAHGIPWVRMDLSR